MTNNKFRVVILTGGEGAHRYFANYLAERFMIAGLVSETKSAAASKSAPSNLSEKESISWWDELREAAEEKYFGNEAAFLLTAGAPILTIEPGQINDEETMAHVAAWRPDIIIVYGVGLLNNAFIRRFTEASEENPRPVKIVNIHLGLAPYYRGFGANLWPIVNGEPEYIGITVHYLDAGIGTGPIIHQARPRVDKEDDLHTIGAKCVLIGGDLMAKTIKEFAEGRPPKGVPQQSKGRLYQTKDWTTDQIRAIKNFIDSGGLAKYAVEQVERAKRIEIIA